MSRRVCVGLAVLFCWMSPALWTVPQAAAPQGPPASAVPSSTADSRAVLDRYCVTCHNERAKTAGLTLDKMDLSNIPADADVWEKVVRKVRVGMMPPQGAPRPDQATRDRARRRGSTTELDRAALAKPNPGRGLIHRLNRAEYANAIRDLLALDVDAVVDAAARRCGVRLRQHRRRARRLAGAARALSDGGRQDQRRWRSAIPKPQTGGPDVPHPPGRVAGHAHRRAADRHGRRHPREDDAAARRRVQFAIRLFRTNLGVVRGLEYEHQLEFTVDGERVHLSDDRRRRRLQGQPQEHDEGGRRRREARRAFRMPLKAGPHTITVGVPRADAPR